MAEWLVRYELVMNALGQCPHKYTTTLMVMKVQKYGRIRNKDKQIYADTDCFYLRQGLKKLRKL